MSNTEIYRVEAEIVGLQKDVSSTKAVIEKLDVTIQKLTDVSSNVSRLLAVHETRLDSQEKAGHALTLLIEKTKQAMDSELKAVNAHIGISERDLRKEIDEKNDEVMEQLAKVTTELKTLQKWMWLVSGGGAVVGFLLANFIKWLPLVQTAAN
jgi:chromosome segregation ATPase